jgi:predicted nucleotidyltransferase
MASRTAPPQTEALARLTRLLVEAARPKRIILFGSEARGQASEDSDLDLLVVTEENFQYWRDTPGNVYFEAATEGQVLYEAP